MSRLSSATSRDATQPSSPRSVDPQIIEALRGENAPYVLKLEELMESLINDGQRQRIALLADTYDQRLLIHLCCAYYHLKPEADTPDETIYVQCTSESCIPRRRLSDLIPTDSITHVHSPSLFPTPQLRLLTGTQTTFLIPLPANSHGFKSHTDSAFGPAGSTSGDKGLKAVELTDQNTGKMTSSPGGNGSSVLTALLEAEKLVHHEQRVPSLASRTLNPWGMAKKTLQPEHPLAKIPPPVDSGSQNDAEFLLGQFEEIKLLYNLDDSWPPDDVVVLLSDIAKGSTDLVSLIVRYLRDPFVGDPQFQLHRLLYILDKAIAENDQEPLHLQDLLYLDILHRIPLKTYPIVKRVLSRCLLTSPVRDKSLAMTCVALGITHSKAYKGLRYLHSVMYIPSPQDIMHKHIMLYNDSLLLFLTDSTRSGVYAISEQEAKIYTRSDWGIPNQTPSGPSATSSIKRNTLESFSEVASPTSLDSATVATPPVVNAVKREDINYVEPRVSYAKNTGKVVQHDQTYGTPIPTDFEGLLYEDLSLLIHLVSTIPVYSGGYTDVFKGTHSRDGILNNVAIQVFRLGKETGENQKVTGRLVREAVVWQRLSHVNILPFIGLDTEHGREGCPALISPWCDNGTIMDFLSARPDANKLQMMVGVVHGLRYLHQQNVVHGGLKPSNILVSDEGFPLLCDFGRSRLVTHLGFTTSPHGTVRYQAPELFEEDARYTQSSDIYALGMTFSEIWTGTMPFASFSNDAQIILQVMVKDARPRCPDPWNITTKHLWELFERCWKTTPYERLTTDQVVDSLEDILY